MFAHFTDMYAQRSSQALQGSSSNYNTVTYDNAASSGCQSPDECKMHDILQPHFLNFFAHYSIIK